MLDGVSDKGLSHFRAVQRRLRENPSPDKPATGAANQPTYDQMMLQLLDDVFRESAWLEDGAVLGSSQGSKGGPAEISKDGKKITEKDGLPGWATGQVPDGKTQRMEGHLRKRLEWHLAELDRRDREVKQEIVDEEGEQKKKITSDDMREGWSSTGISKAQPGPLEDKPKGKKKETVETIEVLNPGADASVGLVCRSVVHG